MEDTKTNNIQSQFVTYKIALKLKELGFDGICLGFYNPYLIINGHEFIKSNIHSDFCLAPLWQQAIDWFREEYEVFINIKPVFGKKHFGTFKVVLKYDRGDGVENLMHPKGGVWYFNSFYEAREEAILKIFKMYI